jgi:serine/threonine protein kinase/tetratricopeptide (TPR) repeat protein
MPLPKGHRLGAYEIVDLLGSGGMGEVYRARDTRLGRDVALKVLPQALAQDPDRRQRFEREARAAAGVNHPHIVTLHSVEESGGTLFLTMELVEGQSLRQVLTSTGLPLDRLLNLGIPIAEAVHAAHRQGITHRDLKPENVMVTSTGWVKVLDFGLAKLTQPDFMNPGMTQAATFVTSEGPKGTVSYMSPEQAEAKPLDHRTDIFSLGVVLYEMATGRRPFQGESTASTLSAILRDSPRPIPEIRRELPPHLNRVIQRCLVKDPDRRYQTALDLRNELELLREEARKPAAFTSGGKQGPKRIVVLPFENLGAADDAFFSAGMTEEITSRLAAVSGLAVLSRTTAVQYDRTGKTLRQIGQDLGADYVLEGTVRWAKRGDAVRVRVTPQLIRVSDDSHLWADRYDRDLDDIFEVQSEIAERVVKEMGVSLLEPERQAVQARPTENMEAYQAYLRGLDYGGRPDYSRENFENAVRMFERAVELDPSFALAHAKLAYYHAQMHFFGYDRSEERLKKAKQSAERALELDPRLPEARRALGKYYYVGPRDYAAAIREFEVVREQLPNQADVIVDIAAAYRRLGDLEKAIELFRQAEALEPSNAAPPFEIGVSLNYFRRFSEAEAAFRKSMALAPDLWMACAMDATNRLRGWGDIEGARQRLLASQGTRGEFSPQEPTWFILCLYERNYPAIFAWVDNWASDVSESQFSVIAADQVRGVAYQFMGQPDIAQRCFARALDRLKSKIAERPGDPRLHIALGHVLSGLDRREEAIREGEEGVRLMPISKDAMVGPVFEQDLALIYAQVGATDRALDRIEHLLSIPSWLCVNVLRLDPRWDPIRDHPRFQALIKEGAS